MARAKSIPYVDPDASLFVHAAVSIGTRLDELISYERYLADARAVYELHQMRIAAKRLRYTMDLFQSAFDDFTVYGKEFAVAVSEVKLLQEHLGNIHDADVLAPKLSAQLHKMLSEAHGKDKHGEPRVGVHLVDFDACQGLLTLCFQARRDRDGSFGLLKSDWERMRAANVFDQWRRLLRNAITDETLAAVLHEPLTSNSRLLTGLSNPLVEPIPSAVDDADSVKLHADSAPKPALPTVGPDGEANAADTTIPHVTAIQGKALNEEPHDPGASSNGKSTRRHASRRAAGADA